jgi:flagellar hook-associated protein 3 FlgL
MVTNLDPESSLFLAQLDRIEQRISDANRQVASGKKINQAADAPDQIDSLLQLRANRLHNAQVQSNLGLAKTDANAADDALSAAIRLMDTAVTLAAQGADTTLDANGRLSLAQQVQAIQQEMVNYSQTAVNGRYVFSGDLDRSPTYTFDASAPNPVVQLANPSSTRLIEDPAGGTFAASKTAPEIFDDTDPITGLPAAGNVFAALNNLARALRLDSASGASDAIVKLKAAADHVNSIQAFYGYVESRIQDASNFAAGYDSQIQTEISQKEDADIPAAALEASQANLQLQAAFEMRAQRPHTSLFSFLG